MKTKRVLSLIVCAVMLLTMIPVMSLTASAAEIEGDWITYRNAAEYPVEGEEIDPDKVYPPCPGYEYTDEGCVVLQPDWTDITPYFTIQTKDKQSIKDGIYLQFRIDEFSYAGPNNTADHWVCLNLNTEANVLPGSTEYGGGWLTLLRGDTLAQPHLTDPKTDDFGGTFIAGNKANVPSVKDDEGRSIFTFEITWDGSAYEMKINDTVMPDAEQATELLEKLNSAGDFYLGITMQTAYKSGTAGLTILKYGTSEADATTPVGSDSMEPEANEVIVAPIADPSTVETNKPAILWSPETCIMKGGNNCTFTVLGDDTWRVKSTDPATHWLFAAKNSWSYAAEDFPVFGMLVRNLKGGEDGGIWYCAGEIAMPGPTHSNFSIYEGDFYEDSEGNEYIFIPIDCSMLGGSWSGRINQMRIDMNMFDQENPEFDICYAGMFRSEDEARAYAEAYLTTMGVDPDATEAPDTTAEPETQAPDTQAPTDDTQAPADDTQAPTVGTQAPADGTETDAPVEGGCKSVIGMSAAAVLVAAVAFVALKKKD